MAYGMLTSFALGAAEGLGNAIVNKYSKDQDAEIKAKADAEREARIEEAAIRSEGRAKVRADTDYARLRTDTLADREIKRGEEMTDQQFAINQKREDERIKQAYENDPTTLAGQAKVAAINASAATNESQRLELETKRKVLEAGNEWQNAKTPEEKSAAEDKVRALTGKIEDKVTLQTTSEITGYDDKGKPITKQSMYWVNTKDHTVSPVETGATVPLKSEDVISKASAKANAIGGTNYNGYQEIKTSTLGMGGDSPEEVKKKEAFNKAYTEEAANLSAGGKPTGMLGSKATPAYSPAPFKADDPAKQKEYDIIFGGVVKQHESGGKGVNAKNPTSTAGGTYQLLDDTAVGYGATRDRAGVVSNAEKDVVAPKFYADVYKSTNGDPAAMIAAGFGQNDIKSAVKDAEKNGTKWWQEIDSSGVKKNMDEVYIRARESVARLEAAGIDPDARLLDFVDNYKATKIASNAPDFSKFKYVGSH
jgi:hypothetical protein